RKQTAPIGRDPTARALGEVGAAECTASVEAFALGRKRLSGTTRKQQSGYRSPVSLPALCRHVERGDAAQLAPMLRIVERPAAVHRGEVVPDDEIAHAPAMAVDEARLGGVLGEIAQQT